MIGFSFAERMAGHCRRPDGRVLPFEFTVRCRAPEINRFWREWSIRLEGTADLEGVGSDLPLEGHLDIDLLRNGRLPYVFSFEGPGSTAWRFDGAKQVSPWRPWRSMTTLVGSLSRDGDPWGEATLRFSLRELPPFLASFRIVPRRGGRPARLGTTPPPLSTA